MSSQWWRGWLQPSQRFETPFPLLRLPAEIQLRILELVLTDDVSQRSGSYIHTISYSGESLPVIRGLDLPSEGIFEVSREVRTLSLRVFYRLSTLPPVYVSRWMQLFPGTWPLAPTLSYTVVSNHYLRRARWWCKAVVPLRTCWMDADGQFLALAWLVSEMRHLQQLSLDIELSNPCTMLEQSRCQYQVWESVFDMLVRSPRLQQVNVSIEAYGRYVEFVVSSTPIPQKHVGHDEINDALLEWLVQHDQRTIVMRYQGQGNVRQDIDALSDMLTFVYRIMVARYCHVYDQGPLRRSGSMQS